MVVRDMQSILPDTTTWLYYRTAILYYCNTELQKGSEVFGIGGLGMTGLVLASG